MTMKLGKLYPQTSPKWDGWEEIYEHTVVGSAETSITISNLSGNTDEVYMLDVVGRNSYAGSCNIYVRPNNDTGNNYGYQALVGEDNVASASRNTSFSAFLLAGYEAVDNLAHTVMILYAKAGLNRTAIVDRAQGIATTTVANISEMGEVWNNSADEITSLVIVASQTGGLGVGSHISLYRRISA